MYENCAFSDEEDDYSETRAAYIRDVQFVVNEWEKELVTALML